MGLLILIPSVPRSKASPHTAQGSAAHSHFLFWLLFIFLHLSLAFPLTCFFVLMGNPGRCRDSFTELLGDIGLPATHSPQSHSQWGSTSHVAFDKSLPERRGDLVTLHLCLCKYSGKAGASSLKQKAELRSSACACSRFQLLAELPRCCNPSRFPSREPRPNSSCQPRPRWDLAHQHIDLCVMSEL